MELILTIKEMPGGKCGKRHLSFEVHPGEDFNVATTLERQAARDMVKLLAQVSTTVCENYGGTLVDIGVGGTKPENG